MFLSVEAHVFTRDFHEWPCRPTTAHVTVASRNLRIICICRHFNCPTQTNTGHTLFLRHVPFLLHNTCLLSPKTALNNITGRPITVDLHQPCVRQAALRRLPPECCEWLRSRRIRQRSDLVGAGVRHEGQTLDPTSFDLIRGRSQLSSHSSHH